MKRLSFSFIICLLKAAVLLLSSVLGDLDEAPGNNAVEAPANNAEEAPGNNAVEAPGNNAVEAPASAALGYISRAEEVANMESKIKNMTDLMNCDKDLCRVGCPSKTLRGSCDASLTACTCPNKLFAVIPLGGVVRKPNDWSVGESTCSKFCQNQNSYPRILEKIWDTNVTNDISKYCFCVNEQVGPLGFTACDRYDSESCSEICDSFEAFCAFNGACICRDGWPQFFNFTDNSTRLELPFEKAECSKRCQEYNYDYVHRVYDFENDGKISRRHNAKHCLCGEELYAKDLVMAETFKQQGFQICTGLKCKNRCQSTEAFCEVGYRRGCYCRSHNIFIGKHLWSRLPTPLEDSCSQSCNKGGLEARVIEWNPLFIPNNQRFDPFYRKSNYQYLYDGKFCHCIQVGLRMNQFKPCTDELCQFFCGHAEAQCDLRTRRACMCNTHKMLHNASRLPDVSEKPCDVICRNNRYQGRILDVKWTQGAASWGGAATTKYCGCVKPVTLSGLTHCEPDNDQCPDFCSSPSAYCTSQKFCYCGDAPLTNLTKIRPPSWQEKDECGERCRSWMWPLAEDKDIKPYIYDDAVKNCPNSTAAILNAIINDPKDNVLDDVPHQFQEAPGSIGLAEAARNKWTGPRRYCLCAKSTRSYYRPGFRASPHMEPMGQFSKIQCIGNHTCQISGATLLIA